jgi:hypothetical protein
MIEETSRKVGRDQGTDMGDRAKPPMAEGAVDLSKKGVHETPQKALEAVGSEFNHWSGKLTETSLQTDFGFWASSGQTGSYSFVRRSVPRNALSGGCGRLCLLPHVFSAGSLRVR